MFGYITPLKSELKVREFEVYSAYYCAVCRAVKRRYGELPRLMLSYDAAFIAMLGDALQTEEKEPSFNTFRCFNNPLRKRNEVLSSPAIDYAADVMVLLGHCGLKDKKDDGDAGNIFKQGAVSCGEVFMRSTGQKSAKKIPEQALEIYGYMAEQAELEAAKTSEIDRAADATGQFMAKIMDFESVPGMEIMPNKSETLQKLGYHMGRFIYIIDAVDDLEKDKKSGAYNPLLLHDIPKETLEISLSLDLANMAECVGKLPMVYHKDIIENIIYLGLNAVKDEILDRPAGISSKERRYLRP